MTTEEPLSRNQERAIDAMLQTSSMADAARVAGIGYRTIKRYMGQPAFVEELKRRRAEVTQETTTGLVVLARRGAEALHELLEDPDTPPSIIARVGIAAQDMARQAVELEDVLARLEVLEKQQADRGPR